MGNNGTAQPTNKSLHDLDQALYLPTFKRYPLALSHGKGCRVWDVEGREFLDALAGIAVNSLGHCHPNVVSAIRDQAERLIHISNFFVSEAQMELSSTLVKLSGLDRAFFANSGAEAVEGAIKIARKYAHGKGRGGSVISMERSFHGRTLATIATGGEKMQRGFGPMPEGFFRVPFNDIEAVRGRLTDDVAAIIVEPVQGEGGIHVAEPSFLGELRDLCDHEDVVLIFDEIQCGVARTGKLFAKDHFQIQPDIMTLAKALGGGFPIGAILSNERVSSAIEYGDHGTTFGGNPLACAAGLATLATIRDDGIVERAEESGRFLRQRLEALKNQYPALKEVRGLGLMIGVEFDFEAASLVQEMMNRGVLANSTAGNVLRLVPPLIISHDEMEYLVDIIGQSLEVVASNP
jgi:acetylornithine/N-succinyldiaminopimelate aminotransferase